MSSLEEVAPVHLLTPNPTGHVPGSLPTTRPSRDLERAERACWEMLAALGIPCTTEGTRETPSRVVRALAEATSASHTDPSTFLERTFATEESGLHDGRDQQLVAIPGIDFHSLCEHHFMTFSGKVTVGFIPGRGARVTGLSKIPRMVDGYARRPQMQERLTQQIIDAIDSKLQVDGAICLVRSSHLCMTSRGIMAKGAEMITLAYSGVFIEPSRRLEFLLATGAMTGQDSLPLDDSVSWGVLS